MIDSIRNLGTPLLVVLGVLIVTQLSLMVFALVSLSKTPDERLRGPRVLWILVIIFGELIGPLVYFAVARLPQTVDTSVSPERQGETRARAESAADLLYGDSERGTT